MPLSWAYARSCKFEDLVCHAIDATILNAVYAAAHDRDDAESLTNERAADATASEPINFTSRDLVEKLDRLYIGADELHEILLGHYVDKGWCVTRAPPAFLGDYTVFTLYPVAAETDEANGN